MKIFRVGSIVPGLLAGAVLCMPFPTVAAQPPGVSPIVLASHKALYTVTLTSNQIPQHSHGLNAYLQSDTSKRAGTPSANGGLSQPGNTANKPFLAGTPNTTFAPGMLQPSAGGGQPHQNQQPYLGINFCIALEGIYPARD